MKRFGSELPEDGAALIVLVRSTTPDKLLPRISPYGGTVVLDADAEERLHVALGEQVATG